MSEEPFVITTTTEILNVKFGIEKTDGITPHLPNLGHKGAIHSATQQQFIKVKFQLKDPNMKPEYTIARLFHSQYDQVTSSVKADYNVKDKCYYAIFDLGDPDVLLPYSGKYTGKIFVADSILEKSLLYTFGNFDIKFLNPRSGAPLSESQTPESEEFEPKDSYYPEKHSMFVSF